MAQFNSCNSKATSISGGALQVLRTTITSVMAITAVLILAGVAVGLSGCSKESTPSSVNATQTAPVSSTPVLSQPSSVAAVVTKKKKPAPKGPSTFTYSSSSYGVSFRFPSQYELSTPGGSEKSALTEEVPKNFAQPGGVTVATIDLPSGSATSFFSVSANQGVTSDECDQFSIPAPSDLVANSPVDESDGSIPSKTTVHGMKFTTVENASEQEDVKYYHHFEPQPGGAGGTCYEFALGVEQSRVRSETLDYPELFDKLERVMATVKIKSQDSSVTANVPEKPASSF